MDRLPGYDRWKLAAPPDNDAEPVLTLEQQLFDAMENLRRLRNAKAPLWRLDYAARDADEIESALIEETFASNPTIYEIELADELAGAFFWALEARLQAILRAM